MHAALQRSFRAGHTACLRGKNWAAYFSPKAKSFSREASYGLHPFVGGERTIFFALVHGPLLFAEAKQKNRALFASWSRISRSALLCASAVRASRTSRTMMASILQSLFARSFLPTVGVFYSCLFLQLSESQSMTPSPFRLPPPPVTERSRERCLP